MRCRSDSWIVIHRIDLFLGETFLKHALSILSGPPGSGKTQFTLSMLCWCIRHHRKVLYIQHGCSFVLDRVIEMLQSQGISDSSCLQDIYIENVGSAYSLFDIAEKYANVALLPRLDSLDSPTAQVGLHHRGQHHSAVFTAVFIRQRKRSIFSHSSLAVFPRPVHPVQTTDHCLPFLVSFNLLDGKSDTKDK